jgi:hypothetical protein
MASKESGLVQEQVTVGEQLVGKKRSQVEEI